MNRVIDIPASYAALISSGYQIAENELTQHQYDAIITWADPVASHVVGMKIKKCFEHLPWVANFTDPWPSAILPDPYVRRMPIVSGHQYRWMLRIADNAEVLVFPCEQMKHHVLKHFTILADKIRCIPHVMSDHDPKTPRKHDMFILMHLGDLTGERRPDALTEGMRLFLERQDVRPHNVRLIFVGRSDADLLTLVEQKGLERCVEIYPQRDYLGALRMGSSASVLIIVEATMSEGIFLPGKLVDYAALGIPILALSPKKGVVAECLRNTKSGLVVSQTDPQEIADSIVHLYKSWTSNKLTHEFNVAGLRRMFGSETVARLWTAAIDNAVMRANGVMLDNKPRHEVR